MTIIAYRSSTHCISTAYCSHQSTTAVFLLTSKQIINNIRVILRDFYHSVRNFIDINFNIQFTYLSILICGNIRQMMTF